MIYPENAVLVPKVMGFITDALGRATTQLQEPFISIEQVDNPILNDPWQLPESTWAFILPDCYILVSFPAKKDEYVSPPDRLNMAQEAATQTSTLLSAVTFKTKQSDDVWSENLLKFYQYLYTWNTDAIFVAKAHPEDIVRSILFAQTIPTYANRSPFVGYCDPNLFLVGSRNYDETDLANKLTQYATLNQNTFLWASQNVSFCYPGYGYGWDRSLEGNSELALSRSISYSITGYLLNVFTVSQLAQFSSQNWVARSHILASAAIYGNAYLSYLIRNVINS